MTTVPAPDALGLLRDWDVGSVAFALITLAGAVAFIAIVRARARGRPIERGRVAALAFALATAAYATAGGVARYDTSLFSAHAAQHVLLGIVAPLFLAAAGPVGVAMRASGTPGRVHIARIVASPPARVLSHPAVAWLLFVPTLYVLYFTPLYTTSLRTPWLHELVHVHFFVVGYLFFANVLITDARPHPLGHGSRILYLLSTVPFHAFLGLAIISSGALIGGRLPARVEGVDQLADQRLGGTLLWVSGELIVGVLVVVVAAQWAASDVATAAREDRIVARESLRGA